MSARVSNPSLPGPLSWAAASPLLVQEQSRCGMVLLLYLGTDLGDKSLRPGYSPQEAKLSTWGGAKKILGKKVHCNWSRTLETKQKVESVSFLKHVLSVLLVFGQAGREVIETLNRISLRKFK